MITRSTEISDILQSETLGELDTIINEIIDEVKQEENGNKSFEKNKESSEESSSIKNEVKNFFLTQDKVTERIDKKIIPFINMGKDKEQLQIILDKTYLAYEFYYEWINKIDNELYSLNNHQEQDKKELTIKYQKEKNLLSCKLTIVYTIRSFITEQTMKDTTNMKELDMIDHSLNHKYYYFKEYIKKTNITHYLVTLHSYKMTDENYQHLKIYHFPFTYACERINLFLSNFINKTYHIYYSSDHREIDSIKLWLSEIDQDKGSEHEKLVIMEQGILEIYWRLRKEQGKFESRLANTLEYFLISPYGLNLLLKYDDDIVPHQIKGEMPILFTFKKSLSVDDMLLFLTTKTPEKINKTSFAHVFKRLIEKLSHENLYIKNRNSINELLRDLYGIQVCELIHDDLFLEREEVKLNAMKDKIVEVFLSARIQAESLKWSLFGGSKSSFMNVLRRFLYQEFGLTEAAIDLPKPKPELRFNTDTH